MSSEQEVVRSVDMIDDVEVEVRAAGSGRSMMVLPGFFNLESDPGFISGLAKDFSVVVPVHPGFGACPRPGWLDSVHDLAYLTMDFVAAAGYSDVTLVGCSFGGWVASEIAIMQPSWLTRLVLVDSVGIRVGGREARDIVDMFATPFDELRRLLFATSQAADRYLGVAGKNRQELECIARTQEAAAVYGWEPYMHDPKLARRLRRISAPTTVIWGADDRLVDADYGRTLANSIVGAKFHEISRAGHFPHLEQPEQFLAALTA